MRFAPRAATAWRAAVALVTMAAATVGSPAAPPASATSPRSVVMVGDSVMLALAGAPYTDAANRVLGGAGWEVFLSAFVGRTTAQGLDVIREERARVGDVVVVALGYNDAADPGLFRARATALVDELADVDAVIWLTLRETRPTYAQANATLRDLAASHPNLRLADWNARANANPSWTGRDGLHLGMAGATGMATLVTEELEDWYAGTAVDLGHCNTRTAPVGQPDSDTAGGYWVLDSAGSVHGVGVGSLGDPSAVGIRAIGIAGTADGDGYWVADDRGRVWAYGTARHAGDLGAVTLNAPIVALVGRSQGDGYWLLGRDGGVFAFGAAAFHGSTGNLVLQRPVVTFDLPAAGGGYWLTASDGGVFSYGSITFHGAGLDRLWRPAIVQLTALPDGNGYWMRDRRGDLLVRGAARDFGSVTQLGFCSAPAVADQEASPTGRGYWMLGADGSVFAFGDAMDRGDATIAAGRWAVGMAVSR